jgi:hypothetical protein
MKRTITLQKMIMGFGLLLGISASAQITVINTNNSGAGSLRQAVLDVEAGGTILFDADIDGNTIMLSSEIEIDKDITIQGNGDDDTIISGSDETRIFVITDADVTINNITLTDGSADDNGGAIWASGSVLLINNTTISGNEANGSTTGQGGGGIFIEDGQLTLNASIVTENEASGTSGSGGGIMLGTDGEVTVNGGSITANFASRAGGGIEVNTGDDTTSLTLNDVTLDANTTGTNPGNGGGLHVTGAADVMISGGTVSNNEAGAEGGGLWNGSGMLTIEGTIISENTASGNDSDQGGGGIYNLSGMVMISGEAQITGNHADGNNGSGGGILNDMGGTLTLDDVEISANTAIRAGGGIEDNSGAAGAVVMTDVTLEGNGGGINPGNGGGLHVTGAGNITITGGEISNNSGSQGGGLWNGSGTMNVTEVEIDGNVAFGASSTDGGGGIYNNGGTLNVNSSTLSANTATGLFGRGGGIHINGGTATVMVTTISGNSSLTNGGGIFNNGDLTVHANTITLNSATLNGGGISNNGNNALSLKNTIVANNSAILSGADLFGDGDEIESEGFNLIGSVGTGIFLNNDDDIVGSIEAAIDLELMALADNGGETNTHRLACPSPAADNGDPDDTYADQNGQGVFGGTRDIGAYEAQEDCATTAGTDDFAAALHSIVYPNPSVNGMFNLDLAPGHGEGANITIYEIGTGKLVKQMTAGSMNMEIGMTNLASGTYVMQIVSDRATETHKLVVGR